MCDTFKAKIVYREIVPPNEYFTFTREIIIVPSNLLNGKKFYEFLGEHKIYDKDKYTLEDIPKYSQTWKPDIRFKIIFDDRFSLDLKMNWCNRMRLRWIHKRMWVQKEPLGLIGTLIALATLIATILKKGQ
jgi:hypothetical protein